MKYLSVLLLVAVVAFGGCKKAKDEVSANLQMSAIINGAAWTSYSSTVAINKNPGLSVVVTANGANSRIVLHINHYHGVGTYPISATESSATYYNFSSAAGNLNQDASSGSIVVTTSAQSGKAATAIKGTFWFLSSGVAVNSGTFDVTLHLD